MEQDDISKWRKVVIKTDGLKWMIDPDETNSSPLEIMEIARRIIIAYDNLIRNSDKEYV